MAPLFSRKSALFLILGVFALLFGIIQGASAATCLSYGGNPNWQKGGNPAINDCTIIYSDPPPDESGLSLCQYRVLSNSVQTIPTPPPDPGWVDAAGICEGSSATLSIDISIGAGLNCRDNGLDKCEVQFRAEDNAGNSATSPPPIVILDIDYSPPSGGSISYINGFIFVTSVVLTVNDGTDSDSGIDTATRTVKRRSSVLVDGGCPGYGSFTEVSTTGDYPLLFDSGLVSGNCYRYQYLVKDNIGNLATYTSPSVVKVDAVAPKVEAFNVIPKDPAWVNIATPDALVSWTVSDTGGSSFKQIEVWRAFDANLNGVLDAGEWDLSPIFIYTGPFGSTGTSPGEYLDDSLVTGTYWYGVHVKDKADNCITEDTSGADKGHCWGVDSDGLDIRPDKGPIKVIVDKTHLITTLTSVADDTVSPYWDTTNNLDTSIELAGEANMLCRWGTTDVVYASMPMVNTCFVLGADALCSLGPLAQAASYTWYVSCTDVAGNDQPMNSALPEGNKDVVFGVDWTAPSGTVVINGGAAYATSTSVTLGLTCTDSVSLCDKMRFSNDGSSFSAEEAFAASKSWPLISGDGTKTVYARYKDTAGNESSSFTDTIILDMTFPGTPDLFAPSGTIATTTPTFDWSDVTDSSGVTYTLWVDNNSDFSSLEINKSGLGSPFYTPSVGVLFDGQTYYWKARAVDGAGNTGSFPAYNTFKIMLNQAPSVSSVSDSPDPIKANAPITFSVSWSDPDAGDLTKIHICKTNAISGQTCSGGSWCDSASFSSTSPTACNYTTLVGDAGTKNYYAFVCDDDNACSSSIFGTFLVDAIAPTISSWGIAPEAPNWANNASPSITVTWNVSDLGGSHLDKVRVYRALFEAGCDDASKASCVWDQAGSDAVAPPNSDNWKCGATCPDRIVDIPGSGTWWYGMHVLDKAQNETIEPTPPGPKKALVDTIEPNSQIQLPASSSWFSNDFTLDTLDEDLLSGSGLNVAQCQYKIIPFEDTNGDGIADTERPSSGWLSRTCNAPPSAPVTTITVGPTDFCNYQARSSCWVYIRSKDVAGNLHTPTQPAGSVKLYNIDWTQPQLGKLYLTANEGDQIYPIQIQLDQSNTYKIHVTDNLKVSGCSLYIDGIDQGAMTPAVPGCETDCTFTKDFTFTGTGTYHNNYAACKDAANNSKSGTSVDIEVKTLSVDLTAIPSLGSIHTLFDLAGTVSGTITGNANFKFDCDINDPTWNFEIDNIDLSTSDSDWVTRQGKQTKVTAPDTFAVQDLCQYPSPGTYTAKIFVQRGVGTAEDTVSIPVSANSVPSAINLSVDPPNSTDYCGVTGYPPVRVNWTFSDADPGDTQGAYELEVFQGAVKVVDTGKKSGDTQSYVFQSAGEQLLWDTTYTWQVRVWDSPSDDISLFAPGLSFTTPSHYYPVPDFTWTPALPGAEESVQFIDQTNFACETCGKTWSWNFGDGGSSTSQNPSHTYVEIGAFEVTLQSTDDVGSCSTQKTVNISIPFPEWQEISPF